MDQTERDELSEWAQRSAALLAPPAGWEPNQKAALGRFKARDYRRFPVRRLLLTGAVVVGITCILAAAVPLTHVFAGQAGISWFGLDQFWYWITIPIGGNLQLVRIGRLPDEIKSLGDQVTTMPGPPRAVSGIAEATQRAGFVPRMPDSSVVAGQPRLSVLEPISFGRVFRTAELESALRQARVTDQSVPAAWDGAWIGAQVGARVTAEWSGVPASESGRVGWTHMTLAQSSPPVFALPPGIDLTSFAALNLRATWMSPDSARRFAQDATPASVLLFDYNLRKQGGLYAAFAVRYVALRHGPAVLIEQWGDLGHNEDMVQMRRLTLLWSAPDRVYVLNGELNAPLGMTSYALAGAVATVIDVANTIH